MARYPYLGNETRTYSQYMQLDAEYPQAGKNTPPVIGARPLVAVPGGVYEIGPCPGYVITGENGEQTCTLAIPPADGLWGEAIVQATVKETISESAAPAKGSRKGASE